ncbi:MAG: signal peptide peptidase SppA [Allosphingosinicella sp.]
MKFAGKVWKLLVGIKDGLVLLFMLLFFALLYAAMTARPTLGAGDRGALLIQLDGPIVEQPAQPTASEVFSGGGPREYRLRDVVHSLRAAAEDDRVKAVALDLDIFSGGGQATLSSVGEALDAVRKAGKPVLAYATAYDDDSYLLAAHASEIWVNPMGGVLVTGPGGPNLYLKGLLDKLGVTANVYKAGTYKAATEPLTRTDMSPEARQALSAVYGVMWENWQQDVRQARPKAQLAPYVADLPGRVAAAGGDMARAALQSGMVDRVGEREAFDRRVAEIVGKRFDELPGSFERVDYRKWAEANPASDGGGRIGIVTVAGDIVDGEADLGTAGAETIVRSLEKGLRERDLKALVVRIDSGGGSALASERIRQALLIAKAKGLPVVASMGSVAASGGYWVATAGDRIYAEPSTITGSIGVFGVLPSFEGAMTKLGLGADGVKTTPLSGEPDLLRGPSPEADRLLQMGVDGTYRRFLALVSAARKMPVEQVDRIAQGRIWAGGTAHQLRLVDSFGGLDDAVREAARLAKLDPEEARAVWLEKEPGFADQLLMSMAGDGEEEVSPDAFSRLAAKPRLRMLAAIGEAERLVSGAAIQARCFECAGHGASPPAPRASVLAGWLRRLLGA